MWFQRTRVRLVTDDESMMSARHMSQLFIDHMDTAFEKWTPRKRYEVFKDDKTICFVLETAPVATRSGYGNHSRDICRALIESDKYMLKLIQFLGVQHHERIGYKNPHHLEIYKRLLRNQV